MRTAAANKEDVMDEVKQDAKPFRRSENQKRYVDEPLRKAREPFDRAAYMRQFDHETLIAVTAENSLRLRMRIIELAGTNHELKGMIGDQREELGFMARELHRIREAVRPKDREVEMGPETDGGANEPMGYAGPSQMHTATEQTEAEQIRQKQIFEAWHRLQSLLTKCELRDLIKSFANSTEESPLREANWGAHD